MATQLHNEIQAEIHSEIAPSFPMPIHAQPATKISKKLVRRDGRDRSQILRRSFQAGFLLLNAWIGCIFYFGFVNSSQVARQLPCIVRRESMAGCRSPA
jgi:hypothetical protein